MLTILERQTLSELLDPIVSIGWCKFYGRSRAVVAANLYRQGLVNRKKFAGSRQYEYRITDAGRAELEDSLRIILPTERN